MILASILLTSDGDQGASLPPLIAENIRSFQAAHPGIEHRLFDDAAIRSLISKNFGKEVLKAYNTLRPFAFKADLARLCILHQFGGIYADLACYFFGRWPPLEIELVLRTPRLCVFRDFLSSTPWDTSQSVLSAPPRHRALSKGIDLICANVKSRYYGPTFLCPTGPTCFGKAISLTCGPDDLVTGDSAWIDPSAAPGILPMTVHGLVFRGSLIAAKRKRRVSLDELGLSTGNDYIALWNSKSVYID